MDKSDDIYHTLLELNDNNSIQGNGDNGRLSNYPRNDSNLEKDIMLLSDMGFEETVIRKVYIFLKPETIDAAIELMSEVRGVYQHKFYLSRNSNVNKCFICGNPKEKHISNRNRSICWDIVYDGES